MARKRKKILITGGAGFIGTNLINALSRHEWEIVVLDALIRQVHPARVWNIPPKVNFIHGDVCDKNTVRKSLKGVNYIVHLAAETGVGQSAYEIARYVKTNEFGTSVLLEEASRIRNILKGIIIASSRAVYGEGRYSCNKCGIVYPRLRLASDLISGMWEPRCPLCRKQVNPLPAVERQPSNPISVYGITKYNQEQLLQQFAETHRLPGIALRFQNIYGPGQSLNNPYTGILAVFSTRILSGNPIFIYEDGNERRDFVFIKDAVRTINLTLKKGFSGNYEVYNVGTGIGTRIVEIATMLVKLMNKKAPVIVAGKHRVGDIRHAWADITKIKRDFGFRPHFSIEKGLNKFVAWVKKQPFPIDRFKKTEKELMNKGLLFEAEKNQL